MQLTGINALATPYFRLLYWRYAHLQSNLTVQVRNSFITYVGSEAVSDLFCYMVSFEAFKKALGKTGNNLSDSEIEKLLVLQCKLADMIFDVWQQKQSTTKANNVIHKKDGNFILVTLPFSELCV